MAASHEAGALLAGGFGTAFSIQSKTGRHNLVTEYDLRCEALLRDRLGALLPEAGFLGEEGGGTNTEAPMQWIVDPLDGTVNFAHGIPIFCVSIALVIDGSIALGVIHHPLLRETFWSVRSKGAWLNDQRLGVSAAASVHDALLVTGFPYNVQDNPDHCIEQFSLIVRQGIPVRRLGSAALDLAYLAAGRFDGFWEVRLHPWDMAAGVLLVEEAGGRVTHYGGAPFRLHHASIVATNGHIHDELVSWLGQVDA
ncbi:MAG: inositol monophosphatase [Candidatus Kapabacteria bacterium]|nr:inositol monophosphatase [Candidatus Kapabacteria bacterium]